MVERLDLRGIVDTADLQGSFTPTDAALGFRHLVTGQG